MPTNQQRRETERRRLQRQLEERRQKEAARKRFTMLASVIGTVVLIAVIVVVIVATTGGDNKKAPQAGGASSTTTSSSPAAPTSSAPTLGTPVACAKPGKGATSSYRGVTVGKATDLSHEPKVSSTATTDPTALECQDLVVGKGKAATPTSTVSVQYTGVLYKNGKQFDSSWARGQAASFSLTGVVPGFTQGIGGTGKVAPMRVGGRRVMILPAPLGYGAQAQGAIPANSSLVFVVDLKSVKA